MDTVLQLVALLFCCLSGGLGPQVSLGQEFRDSPANTVALTNHPITLGCSAPDPSPPPEIDWYHNGFLASSNVGASISYDAGSGRSEYAIGNVGYLDAGVYQCVAVDVLGVALFQSGGGNLTVQGYPAFVQSLSAVTSPIGGEAVFRCEVLSNPPANVSWSFHTSGGPFLPLGNGGRVLISETVLTISNVQASDEGFYECTAENSYGANSTLGRLSIEDLPITLSLTLTPTLSPLVLTAGEELVLRCSPAPGSEVTSLVWQRGAETLSIGVSQDNSGILFTIASVQPADNGTYNCLATDSDGNTESASISVEVYTLPMASVTPSLVSTVANQTLNATLTPRCQATGYPVPEISWLRPNGEPQPSIAGVPQFGALGRNDNGVFQCVATNAVGIGTAQVTFVVEDSPLILSPPVDTEAGAGQLVTFSCLAIGPPEPTISWRRLDSALQSDSVQLEGTLYLFSVTANDNGRYECNATNIYGWRVAAANLTVLPDRPQVVSISSSVATLIGQTFTLNCSVSGPPSTRLDWYHNGSLVSSDSDPRATISLSGSLTIADATASHSGVYACNASTSFAFDAALVDVTVGAVPVILGPPSPSDLPPGSSIFLECRLGGLPHPSTTWYHTSELGVRQSLPAVAERITTHTEGLQLVSLTREDTGVYECLAENALGQASASARLRVEGYPQVTSITPSVLVAGETYLLTCNTLYNYPTATIAWERVDGAPLPEQRLSVNEQGQLVISPAVVEDEGDIRCSATNQYGRSNTTVFVTVYVRPSVLVSPSPFTAILDSSASLSCIVDGRPSPTLVWTLPPSSGGPSSIPTQ